MRILLMVGLAIIAGTGSFYLTLAALEVPVELPIAENGWEPTSQNLAVVRAEGRNTVRLSDTNSADFEAIVKKVSGLEAGGRYVFTIEIARARGPGPVAMLRLIHDDKKSQHCLFDVSSGRLVPSATPQAVEMSEPVRAVGNWWRVRCLMTVPNTSRGRAKAYIFPSTGMKIRREATGGIDVRLVDLQPLG